MQKKDDLATLSNYLEGERLKVIPKRRARKLLVLQWLVKRFTVGKLYSEREVNDLIKVSHPDFATLRRELYDYYLMDRQDGIYWRTEDLDAEKRRSKGFAI